MSLAELNAAATGRSQPDRQAVLDALCLTLASGDGAQRCAAVIALGQVGAAVVAALRDEDEDVRVDAAVALGRLADSTAVAPLLASLTGDPCTDVKAAAIDSLVRFDAREAIPVLRALVTSRGEDVVWDEEELLDWDGWLDIQIKAVAALAALAAEEAAPDLAAALTLDGGQEISAQVMPALAKSPDSSSCGPVSAATRPCCAVGRRRSCPSLKTRRWRRCSPPCWAAALPIFAPWARGAGKIGPINRRFCHPWPKIRTPKCGRRR